jgi:predicted dehydrogenase
MYKGLIVGCGNQGCLADAPGSGKEYKYISFAHALTKHFGFKLAGFVDIDYERAKKAQSIWGGIPYHSIGEAFTNNTFETGNTVSGYCLEAPASKAEGVFTKENIDVAVVATNDNAHYEPLKKLAQYPLRLVIVEKPICEDLRQATEIVKLYKDVGIPLAVNYTRNYQPYYENIKQKYKNGEYGKLIHISAKYNRGLIHTGSHFSSFLDWMFGLDNLIDLAADIKVTEVKVDYRVWQIELFFEKYHWREEMVGDQPVWDYRDNDSWNVVDNMYMFLKGQQDLKCSGIDALSALETCYRF